MKTANLIDLDTLPPGSYVTRKQLSPIIGFSIQTLKRWASANKGPRVSYLEGRPRYRVCDILEWIKIESASFSTPKLSNVLSIEDILNIPCRTDPAVCLCEFDNEWNVVIIRWGGYNYELDLDQINTPEQLLEWLLHITEKGWEEMTACRVGALIHIVCQQKGWAWYGSKYKS